MRFLFQISCLLSNPELESPCFEIIARRKLWRLADSVPRMFKKNPICKIHRLSCNISIFCPRDLRPVQLNLCM